MADSADSGRESDPPSPSESTGSHDLFRTAVLENTPKKSFTVSSDSTPSPLPRPVGNRRRPYRALSDDSTSSDSTEGIDKARPRRRPKGRPAIRRYHALPGGSSSEDVAPGYSGELSGSTEGIDKARHASPPPPPKGRSRRLPTRRRNDALPGGSSSDDVAPSSSGALSGSTEDIDKALHASLPPPPKGRPRRLPTRRRNDALPGGSSPEDIDKARNAISQAVSGALPKRMDVHALSTSSSGESSSGASSPGSPSSGESSSGESVDSSEPDSTDEMEKARRAIAQTASGALPKRMDVRPLSPSSSGESSSGASSSGSSSSGALSTRASSSGALSTRSSSTGAGEHMPGLTNISRIGAAESGSDVIGQVPPASDAPGGLPVRPPRTTELLVEVAVTAADAAYTAARNRHILGEDLLSHLVNEKLHGLYFLSSHGRVPSEILLNDPAPEKWKAKDIWDGVSPEMQSAWLDASNLKVHPEYVANVGLKRQATLRLLYVNDVQDAFNADPMVPHSGGDNTASMQAYLLDKHSRLSATLDNLRAMQTQVPGDGPREHRAVAVPRVPSHHNATPPVPVGHAGAIPPSPLVPPTPPVPVGHAGAIPPAPLVPPPPYAHPPVPVGHAGAIPPAPLVPPPPYAPPPVPVGHAASCYLHVLLDMLPTRAPMDAREIGLTTQSAGKVGRWVSYSNRTLNAYLITATELSRARRPSDTSEYGLSVACSC